MTPLTHPYGYKFIHWHSTTRISATQWGSEHAWHLMAFLMQLVLKTRSFTAPTRRLVAHNLPLLEEKKKGREDEEEDVSNCRMTARKREGTVNWVEEALDRTLWRTGCGRGHGPVVRETTEWRWWIYRVALCTRLHFISSTYTEIWAHRGAIEFIFDIASTVGDNVLCFCFEASRMSLRDHLNPVSVA